MKIVDFNLEMLNEIEREPGLYELSEYVDDQWELILRRSWYGRQFKRAVRDGKISGVRWVRQKSNRHQLYEVLH